MIIDISKNKIKYNSILLSIFFAETLICAIFNDIVAISNISVIITILILVSSISINRTIKCKNLINFTIFIYLLFFISSIINGIDNTLFYLLNFTCFGFTAMVLVSSSIDYKIFFKSLIILYLIYIIFYFIFIRNDFLSLPPEIYWKVQMGQAYSFVPIIITSMAILFFPNIFNLSKNNMTIIGLIGLFSLLFILIDCGTRGVFVSIGISLLFIIFAKLSLRQKKFFLLILIVVFPIIILNLESILICINNIFAFFGIDIPAIQKMIRMFVDNSVDNGRTSLYKEAFNCIYRSPIFGNGIGYFESIYGGYVHNLFLDIACQFGLAGLFFIIYILYKNIKDNIFVIVDLKGVFNLVLFLSSIPTLLFSNSFWLFPLFWIYFFWALKTMHIDLKKYIQI